MPRVTLLGGSVLGLCSEVHGSGRKIPYGWISCGLLGSLEGKKQCVLWKEDNMISDQDHLFSLIFHCFLGRSSVGSSQRCSGGWGWSSESDGRDTRVVLLRWIKEHILVRFFQIISIISFTSACLLIAITQTVISTPNGGYTIKILNLFTLPSQAPHHAKLITIKEAETLISASQSSDAQKTTFILPQPC